MTVNSAVRRLHHDLSRLHHSERELKGDQRDLKKDRRALEHDRRSVDRDRKDLKQDRKGVARSGKALDRDLAARDTALTGLATQRQAVFDRLAADTFDYHPNLPGVQQDPALLARLEQFTQQQTDTGDRFASRIDADRQRKADAQNAVGGDRSDLSRGRKGIQQDRHAIKHDHLELEHDHRAVHHAGQTALEHLRPAEYHLSLKRTNQVRRDLGLEAVDAPIRPGVPNTVGGQVGSWIAKAQTILKEHGIRLSKMPAKDIATIIRFESGGNPNAQNNWDSNAAAGHPSIGLMQTIGPTFDSYKLPGHGNIHDPIDNIIAGVRYAISRYGSIQNVPGIVSVHSGGHYVPY